MESREFADLPAAAAGSPWKLLRSTKSRESNPKQPSGEQRECAGFWDGGDDSPVEVQAASGIE
jgi:hypothetical protein